MQIARLTGAVVVASCLLAAPAYAQEGADLGVHTAHADGDRFIAVPDAVVEGEARVTLDAELGGGFGVRSAADSADDVARGEASLGFGVALFDRVLVSAELPTSLGNETGGSLSDVRTALRIGLWGDPESSLALGLGGALWFPTGDEEDFLGDGQMRGEVRGIVSGQNDAVVYTGNVGFMARKSANIGDATVGPSLVFGGGLLFDVLAEDLLLGPEVYGYSVFPGAGRDLGFDRSLPVSALLSARYQVDPWIITGQLGTGLTTSPGTEVLRINLGFERTLDVYPDFDKDGVLDAEDACPGVGGPPNADPQLNGCPDRDGDRIVDLHDACVDVPGVADPRPQRHGCPADQDDDGVIDRRDACVDVPGVPSDVAEQNGCPPDQDGDRIVDANDACVAVAGVPSDDPARHGCPPDRDGDGIIDAQDACVAEPGVASDDPAKHGCPVGPADRDADGVLDADDACVDEAGIPSPDPTKHGCPLARLCGPQQDEICIEKPVLFKTASDTILDDSADLLTKVAAILKENDDILYLSVDGHTDDRAADAYNQRLSERRAASVVRWLVDKGGIDEARLTSQGFGESQPIAPNDTEEGRAKNRRVEFRVKRRRLPSGEEIELGQ